MNGINNVNTTSVERRFSLSSSQVGWTSSIYDISAGLFVLPITFYGTNGHQPRMLSFAAFVMALGSFIMALPHFITGNYDLGTSIADSCDLSGKKDILYYTMDYFVMTCWNSFKTFCVFNM